MNVLAQHRGGSVRLFQVALWIQGGLFKFGVYMLRVDVRLIARDPSLRGDVDGGRYELKDTL